MKKPWKAPVVTKANAKAVTKAGGPTPFGESFTVNGS